MIRQGELYLADLLDAGRRPVLVVSQDALNQGRYAVVVAFTTRRLEERRRLPTCVAFRAGEFGLSADCVAQAETIASIPAEALDAEPIGRLDDGAMRAVVRAIGEVFSADCSPQ